jgi:flavodoxin
MSKTIVCYFSAEGSTAKVASALSKITGAELFEIKPVTPYTKADINWKNPLSRCNKEKIGKKDVPIEGKVDSFDEYDTIYLGFPIWYYGAPNIINTFVKDYDWTGKKIVLFATSGGSDLKKTAEKLAPYLKGEYTIISQKLVKPSDTSADLKEWVASIG